MGKNNFVKLLILITVFISLAACQPNAQPIVQPTAQPIPAVTTIVPSPTAAPTANIPTVHPSPSPRISAYITSANARLLKEIDKVEADEPSQIVWSKDSASFWVNNANGVALLDSQTFKTIIAYTNTSSQFPVDESSDGKTVAFTTDNKNISLFDISQNKNLLTFQTNDNFGAAFFSPDGSQLVTNSMDALRVDIWNVSNGSKFTTLSGFETAAPVYDAFIGGDGKTLIWHARGTIELQDIASQRMGPTFSHEDFVMAEALSPNGNMLVTAAAGTINNQFTPLLNLWNAHSGKSIIKLANPDSYTSLSFSPDSKLLAAASGNNVQIWDVNTLQKVIEFPAHTDTVTAVAFSLDGKALLTCGADNLIKLWEVVSN
jgi:WD40 repeat protein